MLGQKIDRLLVLEKIPYNNDRTLRYKCLCDCGNIVIRKAGTLKREGTIEKSCGCAVAEYYSIHYAKDDEGTSVTRLYKSYKKGAKDRDLSFELSEEEFAEIIKQPCHYCGIEPCRQYKRDKRHVYDFYYNGIDRMDNKKGYSKTNVVPCCTMCNSAKRSTDYEEFKKWIEKLVSNYCSC